MKFWEDFCRIVFNERGEVGESGGDEGGGDGADKGAETEPKGDPTEESNKAVEESMRGESGDKKEEADPKDKADDKEDKGKEGEEKVNLKGEKEEDKVNLKGEGDEKKDTKEKGDDYELKASEDGPLDEEGVATIEKFSKEHGLKKDQAEKLLNLQESALKKFADDNKNQILEASRTKWVEQAKERWGDEYDKNIVLAERGASAIANANLIKMLNDSGLASHPDFVEAFKKVGEIIADDKVVKGKSGGGKGGMSVEDSLRAQMEAKKGV